MAEAKIALSEHKELLGICHVGILVNQKVWEIILFLSD